MRNMSIGAMALALTGLVALGCGADDETAPTEQAGTHCEPEDDRCNEEAPGSGVFGSAGTGCADNCGGKSPDGCWCDAYCFNYGDCCGDKNADFTGPGGVCTECATTYVDQCPEVAPPPDPCATGNGGCDSNATCTNAAGTAVCACNAGYTGNGQTCAPASTNPCDTDNGGCDTNAFCTNDGGQAACTCQSGYWGDGVSGCSTCGSCADGTFQAAACTNTADTQCTDCPTGCATCASAAVCLSCESGYSQVGGTCTQVVTGCDAGYELIDGGCVDIDECASAVSVSTETAVGSVLAGKSLGSLATIDCAAGHVAVGATAYYYPTNGYTRGIRLHCREILGSGSLGSAVVDTPVLGVSADGSQSASCGDNRALISFKVGIGWTGYIFAEWDGKCATQSTVSGSVGYQAGSPAWPGLGPWDWTTSSAKDLNCADGSMVVGLQGHIDGFLKGVRVVCAPIGGDSPCPAGKICNNTEGSFACGDCYPGFELVSEVCTDLDECGTGTSNCSPYASCSNEVGGFSCACSDGYWGDGETCNLDPCLTDNGGCDQAATCSSVEGVVDCSCPPNWGGDGFSCINPLIGCPAGQWNLTGSCEDQNECLTAYYIAGGSAATGTGTFGTVSGGTTDTLCPAGQGATGFTVKHQNTGAAAKITLKCRTIAMNGELGSGGNSAEVGSGSTAITGNGDCPSGRFLTRLDIGINSSIWGYPVWMRTSGLCAEGKAVGAATNGGATPPTAGSSAVGPYFSWTQESVSGLSCPAGSVIAGIRHSGSGASMQALCRTVLFNEAGCDGQKCNNLDGAFSCEDCEAGFQVAEAGEDCVDINECDPPFQVAGEETLVPLDFAEGSQTLACPSGHVVTGYNVSRNSPGNQLFYAVRLQCRQLKNDGSFGTELLTTDWIGAQQQKLETASCSAGAAVGGFIFGNYNSGSPFLRLEAKCLTPDQFHAENTEGSTIKILSGGLPETQSNLMCPAGEAAVGIKATTNSGWVVSMASLCKPLGKLGYPCAEGEGCQDEPGSFACGACESGYAPIKGICTDVNECAFGTALDPAETAITAQGGNAAGSKVVRDCPSGMVVTGLKIRGHSTNYYVYGVEMSCKTLTPTGGLSGSATTGWSTATGGQFGNGNCPTGTALTKLTVSSGWTPDVLAKFEGKCKTPNDIGNGAGSEQNMSAVSTNWDPYNPETVGCPAGYVATGFEAYVSGQTKSVGLRCTKVNVGSGSDPCPGQQCLNTEGGFGCGACPTGHVGSPDGCIDVDECGDETDNCPTNSTCYNTAGAFDCVCHEGYSGASCADINECSSGNDCDSEATCSNSPGSYTCSCPGGSTDVNGKGTKCWAQTCAPEDPYNAYYTVAWNTLDSVWSPFLWGAAFHNHEYFEITGQGTLSDKPVYKSTDCTAENKFDCCDDIDQYFFDNYSAQEFSSLMLNQIVFACSNGQQAYSQLKSSCGSCISNTPFATWSTMGYNSGDTWSPFLWGAALAAGESVTITSPVTSKPGLTHELTSCAAVKTWVLNNYDSQEIRGAFMNHFTLGCGHGHAVWGSIETCQ